MIINEYEPPQIKSNWGNVTQIFIDDEAMEELHDDECRSYKGNIQCGFLSKLPMMPDKLWCRKYEKILKKSTSGVPKRTEGCSQLKFKEQNDAHFVYTEV